MIDLNTRVPASGRVLQRAIAINEVGQIVAYIKANTQRHRSATPVVDTEPPWITTASVSTRAPTADDE